MKTFKYLLLVTVTLLAVNSVFSRSENRSAEDASDEVIALTQKEFLQKIYNFEIHKDSFVYEGSLPCIIDFYADWCPPCKVVEPILKDLAKEYKGKINIYKINVDKERQLASAFGIQAIPTYFFVTGKGKIYSENGAMPRESFVIIIDEVLLK
jgi:thioredoxin